MKVSYGWLSQLVTLYQSTATCGIVYQLHASVDIAKDTSILSAVKRTWHDERSLRHAVHVAYRVRFQ